MRKKTSARRVKPARMESKLGESVPDVGTIDYCEACGHQIEWAGIDGGGWLDRRGINSCQPYARNGVFLTPEPGVGHAPQA